MAAVTDARAGVSALRILLGQFSKISACWHHPLLQAQNLLLFILFTSIYYMLIEFFFFQYRVMPYARRAR